MKIEEISDLIAREQWDKLCKDFTAWDEKTQNINDHQREWKLPLQMEGWQIAHRLRNHLMSFVSHYKGVKHLGGKSFRPIALKMDIPEIEKDIKFILDTRDEINAVYAKISKYLYNT